MYLVVQCPKCGNFQSTSAKTLKCKYCNRSTKITGKDGYARVKVYGRFAHPGKAAQRVREVSEEANT